jgi:hypothetical protein
VALQQQQQQQQQSAVWLMYKPAAVELNHARMLFQLIHQRQNKTSPGIAMICEY